jgi:hypothetical protein
MRLHGVTSQKTKPSTRLRENLKHNLRYVVFCGLSTKFLDTLYMNCGLQSTNELRHYESTQHLISVLIISCCQTKPRCSAL